MKREHRQRLYTFNDAWTAWLAGDKFPIAFFGDSTIDGSQTTGWVRNTLGSDHQAPHAYPAVLERLLRQATGNTTLRIYNAGFSGQIAKWAATVMEEEFGDNSAYRDVKMIGIGFGINDRLGYEHEQAYRQGFKQYIEEIIHWCLAREIQPFLLTTQAVVEPGVLTQYIGMYPMRTSEHIATIANEVKRELAEQYDLQLVDLNRYTEEFMQYSSVGLREIIPDQLHFGDRGHQYEAEVLFAHLCPRTIWVDTYTRIDYSSQKITDSVPQDLLTFHEDRTELFKVYLDYNKDDTRDMKVMSAWVFNHSRKPMTLSAYKGKDAASTSQSSKMYIRMNPSLYQQVHNSNFHINQHDFSTIIMDENHRNDGKADVPSLYQQVDNSNFHINDAVYTLEDLTNVIGYLEMGLHRLEVFTGESTTVDFRGFVIE